MERWLTQAVILSDRHCPDDPAWEIHDGEYWNWPRRQDSYIEVLPNTKYTRSNILESRGHALIPSTKKQLLYKNDSKFDKQAHKHFHPIITKIITKHQQILQCYRDVKDGAVLQTWHCLPRANQSPCASTIPSVIVSITIPISHHHHHHYCNQRLCSHLKPVREL